MDCGHCSHYTLTLYTLYSVYTFPQLCLQYIELSVHIVCSQNYLYLEALCTHSFYSTLTTNSVIHLQLSCCTPSLVHGQLLGDAQDHYDALVGALII